MMWRGARDKVLLARIVENSKHIFQAQNEFTKIAKAERIKHLKKEEKLLFGELVETKRQKVRRIKLEERNKIPRVIPSTIDTEYSWMIKSTSRLKIMHFSKTSDSFKQGNPNKTDLISNYDTPLIPKTEESTEVTESTKILDSTNKKLLNAKSSKKLSSTDKKVPSLKTTKKLKSVDEKETKVKSETSKSKKKDPLQDAKLESAKEEAKIVKSETSKSKKKEPLQDAKLDSTKEEVKQVKSETTKRKKKNPLVSEDAKLNSIKEEVTSVESETKTQDVKEVTNVASETKPTKSPLLSEDVVKRLLQFPILDKLKDENDTWISWSQIMSISPMENRSCLKYPSVTKILSATMTEEAKAVLEHWKMQMIEKLGEKGFAIYQAELLADGKSMHAIIMNKLSQKKYEVPDSIKNSVASLEEVLKDVDEVRAMESHVIHPTLLYRGIVDCVANYRGELCLIDWKKSDKKKSSISATYDAPLQLASYIGALNADRNYPYQIKKGIIAVAYTDGEPAQVHEIDEDSLYSYWKLWLRRLQDYHVALTSR